MELLARLEKWGIETRTEIRSGDPADEILAPEVEYDQTTILVGSRSHSRLRRPLLGSAEHVVARANGNVMLVPPER